jgi:hypothetical protein
VSWHAINHLPRRAKLYLAAADKSLTQNFTPTKDTRLYGGERHAELSCGIYILHPLELGQGKRLAVGTGELCNQCGKICCDALFQ